MTENLGQDYNNLLKQNNEIIIDGVNVAECDSLREDLTCANEDYHLFNFVTKYIKCENCNNCYFKQLQREKEKNKELRNNYNSNVKRSNDLGEKYHKLIKALKGIREIAESADKNLDEALDPEKTDSEESFDLLYEVSSQIEQILQKAKEVMDEH